ncbi:MAG: hypothetical protein ACREE0_23345 [Phenylobacterium sp.]
MVVAFLFYAALMVDQTNPGGGAPAAAPSSAPAVSTATPSKTAKADPDRVCKLEPVLGSKITKKVCYNRAQLDERTFYDKQNLDLMQAKTPGPFIH